MNKKKITTILNQLNAIFSSDKDALKAIELLEKKSLKLEFSKELSESGEFSIPREMQGLKNCYAVFSDGACRGNPGPGAYGAIGQSSDGKVVFESSGVELGTTNNRMEMTGAVSALHEIELLSNPAETVVFLYSDSKYVVDGLKSWMHGWKRRGWKKADKKAPENLELWKQLDQLTSRYKEVNYFWVKGHAGHPQNERCDELANIALDEAGF